MTKPDIERPTPNRRRVMTGAVALGASTLLARPALAQAWAPTKTVRVIVPFPAGATTDMLARLFAQRMTESLGQTVLVENIGGAGGALGADHVAKAAPDGHTLLFHNITFTTTTTTNQLAGKSRHDIEKDFEPISVGAYVPFWLLAHPSVPANDLKEFVAWAKTTKDKLNYGSTGPGSIMNLMGEVLKRDGGISMQHVPYKGAAPLVTEMLAGRIQFGGDQLSSSLQHVRSGALKAMAVATPSAAMPKVPTVRQLGFPNLELQGWNGFLAPRGTPAAAVARLQREIAAASKHPTVVKRMTDVGAEPSGSTSEEMRAMLRDQIGKVRPIVAELKLTMQ